jgi:hypothetical protein
MGQRPDIIVLKSVISIWSVVAIAIGMASCRPAPPERARLWSERTAEDFDRLVRSGRKVAQVGTAENSEGRLFLAGAPPIGGLTPYYVDMDDANEAVIFAQFDTRSVPAIKRTSIDSFTQQFIQKVAQDLRIDPLQLRAVDVATAHPNQVTKAFTREISGVPVRDSRLIFVFSQNQDTLRLMEIQNRTFGHLSIATRPMGEPLNESRIAQVLRNRDVKITASGQSYIVDQRLNPAKLAPSTWYQIAAADGKAFTLTFSGGDDPALLEAYSHRTDAALQAIVYSRSWAGDKIQRPVPEVTVETANGRQTLNDLGQWPGSPASGRVEFSNSWFRSKSDSGQPTAFDVVIDGNQSLIKTSNNEPSSIPNVYVALTRVRALARQYLSITEVPFFNQRLTITTDINQSCNAFYQGRTLNFFAKGGNCANMAFVNDVIYHEWGHGLDDHTGPGAKNGGGMSDGAFSEGIGDIIAMFMTQDNIMGVGFFTSDAARGIRNLDNKKVYVAGEESDVHSQGTIIGGAFWELRRRMINKYGDAGHDRAARLFFRHLIEAESYLQSYQIVQRLADDDNNPATRHADWCLINHAFSKKKLTTEDACQDDFDTPSVGLESKIFFALGNQNTNNTTPVFISSTHDLVAAMRLCPGRDSCATPVNVPLFKQESGVKIFGPVTWTVSDNLVLNADALDAAGKTLAKRIVRMTRK